MKCKHFERRLVQHETRLEEIMKLWRDVAVAVAGSDNCVRTSSMNSFAMQAVNDYSEFVMKIEAIK